MDLGLCETNYFTETEKFRMIEADLESQFFLASRCKSSRQQTENRFTITMRSLRR